MIKITLKQLNLSAILLLGFTTLAFSEPRIVGGYDAQRGDWPWIVGLIYSGDSNFDGLTCGATLINSTWVITAAHCMIGETTQTLQVVGNLYDLKKDTGITRNIKRIIVHPAYNQRTEQNDLALLELTQPITDIPPIPNLNQQTDIEGSYATAIGWGRLGENNRKYPSILQEVQVPIASDSDCKRRLDTTSSMLCAGEIAGGKDTCQGDSGGPLMLLQQGQWTLVGVTSWGTGCARPRNYGVYTRVSEFIDYIDETINTDYFALADVNNDNKIDQFDKTSKVKALTAEFTLWRTQCWLKYRSCADVNNDNRINQLDYSHKQKNRQIDYTKWLNIYWKPELI